MHIYICTCAHWIGPEVKIVVKIVFVYSNKFCSVLFCFWFLIVIKVNSGIHKVHRSPFSRVMSNNIDFEQHRFLVTYNPGLLSSPRRAGCNRRSSEHMGGNEMSLSLFLSWVIPLNYWTNKRVVIIGCNDCIGGFHNNLVTFRHPTLQDL